MKRIVMLMLLVIPAEVLTADYAAQDIQVIPFFDTAPTLDGILNESQWQQVKTFSPFLITGKKQEAAPEFQTVVKAFFTKDALYFGVTCYDPLSANRVADYEAHDSKIHADDDLEIFIKPEAGGRYYQLVVNSKAGRFDAAYAQPTDCHADWNPEPDWQAKTAVGTNGWTVEMAIPFASLWTWKYPPQPGEGFQLIVCRQMYVDKIAKHKLYHNNFYMAWNDLEQGSFNADRGWRDVLLGGKNIIKDADFVRGADRKRLPLHWVYENRQKAASNDVKIGAWEYVKDPEPGISDALKLVKLKEDTGVLPRLCILNFPLRPGFRYCLNMNLKSDDPVTLYIGAGGWWKAFHSLHSPPRDGGKRFVPIRLEFEPEDCCPGKDVPGWMSLLFGASAKGSAPRDMLMADLTLTETKSNVPKSSIHIVKYDGLDTLADCNFGLPPFELQVDKTDGTIQNNRVIFRDPVTGAQLWKVSHFEYGVHQVGGYGTPCWSADGKFWLFNSDYFPRCQEGLGFINSDATRMMTPPSHASLRNPGWSKNGHLLYSQADPLWGYDPLTQEKTNLFALAKVKAIPGEKNRTVFSRSSMKVIQFAPGPVGSNGFLRVWSLKDGGFEDVPIQTRTKEPFRAMDSLDSVNFFWLDPAGESISYGLNTPPRTNSIENAAQAWLYHLRTQTCEIAPPFKPGIRRHRGWFPTGRGIRCVGWSDEGLAYQEAVDQNSPLIFIGEVGTDGHVAYYHEKVAVTMDFEDNSTVAMILPETRTVIPITYAQHRGIRGYESGSTAFIDQSPDSTKLAYTTEMLGYRDLYWGVMQYPLPPVNVRVEKGDSGAVVRWDKPERSAEMAGYWVYRSEDSGRNYTRLTSSPVEGVEYQDASAQKGKSYFYALRSVESSSLISKTFSEEAEWGKAGAKKPRRIFREAEYGNRQQTPFRLWLDKDAANEQCMQIKIKEDEKSDSIGVLEYSVRIPAKDTYQVWVRLKKKEGTAGGALKAQLDSIDLGEARTDKGEWEWTSYPVNPKLKARSVTLTFTGKGHGLMLDRFLITSDTTFAPQGKGSDIPQEAPLAVADVKTEDVANFHIRLAWKPSADPELHHYQVYRKKGADAQALPACLVSSPAQARCLDYNLHEGEAYTYRVTAVDNWGNESPVSDVLRVQTRPLEPRVVQELHWVENPDPTWPVVDLGEDKPFKALKLRFETTKEWIFPFEVPVDGDYVIWLHGAPEDSGVCAQFFYQVDHEAPRYCRFVGPPRLPGEKQSQRLQWTRLMQFRQDVGTKWFLRAGNHGLILKSEAKRPCTLLFDKMVVANDLSYTPPGEKFTY